MKVTIPISMLFRLLQILSNGGLSGCTFEEAISWGKKSEEGNFVQCYCDATIALPIVTHALKERLKFKRNPSSLRTKEGFFSSEAIL